LNYGDESIEIFSRIRINAQTKAFEIVWAFM